MVFYVFALQCVSTVAVVRRETNSWKWPLFQWLYMGVLAWGLAFVTWHGRPLAGLGLKGVNIEHSTLNTERRLAWTPGN